MIKYSYIIPVKEINAYILESLPIITADPRKDYEVIIYPDELPDEQYAWPHTRLIASGKGGPAMKRSLAMRDAKGEIIIFVDDDAYPEPGFLDLLDRDFADPSVTAIGGPAVTPDDDPFWARVSGAVFLSPLSGGFPERYAPVGRMKDVDDWPTVNLSVRKDAFVAINGFDTEFWPGEDTKFCLDLIEKGGRIIYDPELIVYHHRRSGYGKHLKQVGGYGLHRGYFAKKYPKTSLRPKYFVPSAFFLFVLAGGAVPFLPYVLQLAYAGGGVLYACALALAARDILKFEKNFMIVFFSLFYIMSTHVWYGVRFLKGFLFTPALKSKLR